MTTPNTLLAAARLAYPDVTHWQPNPEGGAIGSLLQDDGICSRKVEFEPFSEPKDAYALEDKLMDDENGGWIFNKRIAGEVEVFPVYRARSKMICKLVSDRDRATLLLKCVETLEAMK